eukprot:6341203-Prymnesium_polylepis.1
MSVRAFSFRSSESSLGSSGDWLASPDAKPLRWTAPRKNSRSSVASLMRWTRALSSSSPPRLSSFCSLSAASM